MPTIPEEEAIIIMALVRFSVEYEDADEELAATAWELARQRAADYDLSVEEVTMQLDVGR